MREYYGTYKMGNGTFFEVYEENGKYYDVYGQEITDTELKKYERA